MNGVVIDQQEQLLFSACEVRSLELPLKFNRSPSTKSASLINLLFNKIYNFKIEKIF